MATGTTPMTGTMRTGMTGMRPAPPKQGIMAKVILWWKSLTPRQRILVYAAVGMAFLLIVGTIQFQKANAYVNLYENALSSEDLADVTQALTQLNIPYSKTLDSHLTVPPRRRVEALAALTKQGIPHHPFLQMTTGDVGQTHEAFTEMQHEQLERDLTMVLRQFDEIADANVKLVMPTDKFFVSEQEDAKAAIVIRLKSGYDKLPLPEAKSIVHLVSASVPNLKPENVQLSDTSGKLLTDLLKNADDETSTDNMIQRKKSQQTQLEEQISKVLEPALGAGKYAVAVNVDLNWNQQEDQVTRNGNPELNPHGSLTSQEQIKEETYDRGGSNSSGMKQIAFPNTPPDVDTVSTGRGGKYHKKETLVKNEVDKVQTHTIVTPGQPQRISATVLVDQSLSDATIRTLTRSVRDAIGINEERGDSLSFGALPFHHEEIRDMGNEMNVPSIFRHNGPSVFNGDLVLRVGMAMLVAGIIVIGLYLYRQHKAELEKSELVLAAGPNATVSDISDLLTDKTGKVSVPPPSRVQQTEKLEELVKERPTKVAELLKTTWLAEK